MTRIHNISESAFYIDDFLDTNACAEWVRRTENLGYAEAPVTTAAGPVMMPDVRNNRRVMIDDADAASLLFDKIESLIPPEWRTRQIGDDVWKCVGLNERLRFYRYEVGQEFKRHRDGHYVRNADEKSLLTVLIYLNDVPGGGATTLRIAGEDVMVTPTAGRMLLFNHRVSHAGEPVLEGMKYVLRTDVMFHRFNDLTLFSDVT